MDLEEEVIMDKITIVINEGPGSLKAWNALRLAGALVGEGVSVHLFLLDDGVYIAKVDQKPVSGLSELNLAGRLEELMGLGVTVQACGVCANARGLKAEEYIPGIPIVSIVDLARSIKESRQVLVF